MPRQVTVPRLGLGGRNTDKPSWGLRPDELADGSQDGLIYEGALRRRRGFKVSTVEAAAPFRYGGVVRALFPLTGRYQTYVTRKGTDVRTGFFSFGTTGVSIIDGSTGVLINTTGQPNTGNPAGVEYDLNTTTGDLLPRAFYNGELLFCPSDGTGFVQRVSGLGSGDVITSNGASSLQTVAGSNVMTSSGGAGTITVPRGFYYHFPTHYPNAGPTKIGAHTYMKFIAGTADTTGSSVQVEGMKASIGALGGAATNLSPVGWMFPCIPIYSAGKVSCTTNVLTIVGGGIQAVLQNRGLYPLFQNAPVSMLVLGASTAGQYVTIGNFGIINDTQISTSYPNFASTTYIMCAPPAFVDVCVHNNFLYGGGDSSAPNRIFIAPAGWGMTWPPGAVLPFDPTVEFSSANASDFLLDFEDVPSPFDDDPFVAILATDGPRLVLKSNSVYGLYGEPPFLTQRLINAGDGCIDIRSAISVTAGAFWCGTDGIYRYKNGSFTDLTSGWMQNEWRTITNAGIDFCATGVSGRHLSVSVKTADAAQSKRYFLFDLELGRWLPEVTNIHPRHFYDVNIAGETQSLLCLDDAYTGKVLNMVPALDQSGPARDEAGAGPNFQLVTGDSFTQADGIEGETRIVELDVHTVVRDAAGTTTLAAKVLHGGSLYATREGQSPLYDSGVNWDTGVFFGPDGCRDVGNITNTTHDEVTRNEFPVNRTGRRARLQINETTTSTTVGVVEIGETIVRLKDSRRGS